MSISRLKSKESSEVQGVVAITLAILSQLIQFTITRLQESFIETETYRSVGVGAEYNEEIDQHPEK